MIWNALTLQLLLKEHFSSNSSRDGAGLKYFLVLVCQNTHCNYHIWYIKIFIWNLSVQHSSAELISIVRFLLDVNQRQMNGTIWLMVQKQTHIYTSPCSNYCPFSLGYAGQCCPWASPQLFTLSFKTTRQRRLKSIHGLLMKCHLGSPGIWLYSSKMILNFSVKMFTQKKGHLQRCWHSSKFPFCYNFQRVFWSRCWWGFC